MIGFYALREEVETDGEGNDYGVAGL